jgi:hypothetical protein
VLEVVAPETYPIAWMQSPTRSAIVPSILPALHILLLLYSACQSDVRKVIVIPKLIGFEYGHGTAHNAAGRVEVSNTIVKALGLFFLPC